jgi:hypothetical protein
LETGIRRHQTRERRHAHYVGYTMGYPSEHGVNLTFEINYLRVAVNPTLSLQNPVQGPRGDLRPIAVLGHIRIHATKRPFAASGKLT